MSVEPTLAEQLSLAAFACKTERDIIATRVNAYVAADGRSSLTGISDAPPNLDEYHNDSCITLHLATWWKLAHVAPEASDAQKRKNFRYLISYFLRVAERHNLEQNPAYKIVQRCFDISLQKRKLDLIDIKQRIQSEREPTFVSLAPDSRVRQLLFQDFPLHNFFDALALLYTLCVDDILTDREGELYLLQLRFVARAFLATGYFSRAYFPATVGASWQKKVYTFPFSVCFSFSCVGNKHKGQKAREAASRVNYAKFLYDARKAVLKTKDHTTKNDAGNCPEFLNWGTVSRDAGTYRTLCLNIPREKTMRCCNECEEVAEGAKVKNISIVERYRDCSLVDGSHPEGVNVGGYDVCTMKELKTVIAERRGRKVHRK